MPELLQDQQSSRWGQRHQTCPDFEGWRVDDPPPGTYIEAKPLPYYMCPTSTPPGEIGFNGNFDVNLYGVWRLKEDYAIPYLPNKVYRARYRIRTDQPEQSKVPMIRMRWNNIRFHGATSQHVDKGSNAPITTGWTDYYSYFLPPDLSGLPPTESGLILNFDLVDFSDVQSGSLFVDEVEVQRFSEPARSVATNVLTHENADDFSYWDGENIPNTFGICTFGSDSNGLYLESGVAPTPPTGMEGLPDYGSWYLPTNTSPILYETGRLYRAVFTLKVPNPTTQQTLAKVRLRLQNGMSDWSNVYEIIPLGPTAYYDHMPSVTGTDYSVFMECPRYLYPSGEEWKNKITVAFDLVDGKSSEYGRAYLTKVDIEYYDIP